MRAYNILLYSLLHKSSIFAVIYYVKIKAAVTHSTILQGIKFNTKFNQKLIRAHLETPINGSNEYSVSQISIKYYTWWYKT